MLLVMEILLFYATAFGAPFALAIVMPGWRSLIALGLVYGVLAIFCGLPLYWAGEGISNISPEEDHGGGLIIVLMVCQMIFALVGAGLASGLMIRTRQLLKRRSRVRYSRRVMVAVLLTVIPPAIFCIPDALQFGTFLWNIWKRR